MEIWTFWPRTLACVASFCASCCKVGTQEEACGVIAPALSTWRLRNVNVWVCVHRGMFVCNCTRACRVPPAPRATSLRTLCVCRARVRLWPFWFKPCELAGSCRASLLIIRQPHRNHRRTCAEHFLLDSALEDNHGKYSTHDVFEAMRDSLEARFAIPNDKVDLIS